MNQIEQRKTETQIAREAYYRDPILCRVCAEPVTFLQWQKASCRPDVFCGTHCKIAWLSRLNADRVRV